MREICLDRTLQIVVSAIGGDMERDLATFQIWPDSISNRVDLPQSPPNLDETRVIG